MGKVWALILREPALTLGAVQAIVALGVSFGADLTGEQVGAITAATAAILSVLTRAAVTPNVTSEGIPSPPK